MAPAFVQATNVGASSGNAGAANLVFPSDVTTGNTLVIIFFWNKNTGSVPPVLTAAGYDLSVPLSTITPVPGQIGVDAGLVVVPITSTGPLTLAGPASGQSGTMVALEYSGLNADLDQTAAAGLFGPTGIITAGPTGATDTAPELLLSAGCTISGTDFVGDGTYTSRVHAADGTDFNGFIIVQDQVAGATGTFSADMDFTGTSASFGVNVLWTLRSNVTTHSISGNISGPGGAGATVSYTGPSSGNVTADGSGNFTIPGLADGDFVVTPTNAGFAFTPTSQNVTVSGADVTGVNFSSALGVYSPVDSRDFATFPNQFRTVQGSKIYDVQTSSNASVPSADSRAAGAPVDSRVAPNIPQNSRAPLA